MKLFFLRHGRAEDAPIGGRDYDRKLTEAGIAEMRKVAKGLARVVGHLDVIIASPLPRALETARLAADTLRIRDGIDVSDRLSPGAFDLDAVRDLTASRPSGARIMFVGHEPSFSGMVRELTGAGAEMKKTGLAVVETDRAERDAGELRLLLSPAVLILVGGDQD